MSTEWSLGIYTIHTYINLSEGFHGSRRPDGRMELL